MKINVKYRLYGRSKGRGKKNALSDQAKRIIIKKIDLNKYNIIDVGVGYGESTIEIAKIDKNKNVVACEKYIDGINSIAKYNLEHGLTNISIFNGNVNQFLDEYCPPNSISEMFILFPDPWPKKRHFKRRLINENFFNKIKFHLKSSSLVHIASDSKTYISSILLSVYNSRKDYKWINQQKENWDYENSTMPKTKYFRKALEKGDNSFYLKLMKI